MCTIDSFVPRPKFLNNAFRKTFENDIQYFIIFINTDYIIFGISIFFTIVLKWAKKQAVRTPQVSTNFETKIETFLISQPFFAYSKVPTLLHIIDGTNDLFLIKSKSS